MTDIANLKKGTTLKFIGGLSKETFDICSKFDIDCVELSYSYDELITAYDFPNNGVKYAEIASEAGIELWSLHLPFSDKLDISSPIDEDRKLTMRTNKMLICAAATADIKTIVLHPSAEPISDDVRTTRLDQSRTNIMILAELCHKYSLTLAVENLPRTCLCNTSTEMAELLAGTGVTVCFDTNHSLQEDDTEFLSHILNSGLTVSTLHISDYDFIDEKHRLPGDGVVKWRSVLQLLERNDYSGPLMYEVSKTPRERESISIEELAENQRRLAQKLI